MKRTKTNVLSFLLSAAMCGSIFVPAYASESRYGDTSGHWAQAAVERWSEYGVIAGDGDSFNPDGCVTRGQMATVLSKTLGLTAESENPFVDVPEDGWYTPYVLRCHKAGIMLGDDGRANPDSKITRQEAMTMFCRAFSVNTDETADLTAFNDGGEVADWARPYVSALINGGIVSGVSSDRIAPLDNMSRAALVTILDRAVIQYINASGEYDLTAGNGIVLVTAGNTTLKGTATADILITQAADGKTVTFKNASVSGKVTVLANTKIVSNNSTLSETNVTVEKTSAVALPINTNSKKKSSGSGGSSGSSAQVISDLTIEEEKTITNGTYNNVTVTEAVGDGEVTLDGVTIKGDLIIKGGGSNSVYLDSVSIGARIVMSKKSGAIPRLELTNTSVNEIEVQNSAIIEAKDIASFINYIQTYADVEIRGENTKVNNIKVLKNAGKAVNIAVKSGSVSTIDVNSETNVTGAKNSVGTIVAKDTVTTDSETTQNVEVPDTAADNVNVTVTGDDAVDVEVNTTNGANVTGTNVTVSTTLENDPSNVTLNGGTVTHVCKWGNTPAVTDAGCETEGNKVYTCTSEGCGKTKTEIIPKLGHDWGEWKKLDNTSHKRICKRDANHVEKANHRNGSSSAGSVTSYVCEDCQATVDLTEEKIVLFQDEYGDMYAHCPTYGCENLRVATEDDSGNSIWGERYSGSQAYDWKNMASGAAALTASSGTKSYSLVIYNDDTNEELGRLDGAIVVSVEGEAIQYDIKYNDEEVGRHSINITTDDAAMPKYDNYATIWGWFDKDGWFSGWTEHAGKNKEAEIYETLSDGDVCDMRIMERVFEDQVLKVTVTPPSKKTYSDANEPSIRWSDGGTVAWKKSENAQGYRLNLYSQSATGEEALVKTADFDSNTAEFSIGFYWDIAELANYEEAVFSVEVQTIDANDEVTGTVGKLTQGIEFGMEKTAPEFSYVLKTPKTYTINFADGTPTGLRNIRWVKANGTTEKHGAFSNSSGPMTADLELENDIADGDKIEVYITTVNTASSTVWKFTRTPTATKIHSTSTNS